jgi:hypothetical protein
MNTSNSTLNPLIGNLAAHLRSYFETPHQVNFVADELNLINAEMMLAVKIFAGLVMGTFNEHGSFQTNGLGVNRLLLIL